MGDETDEEDTQMTVSMQCYRTVPGVVNHKLGTDE